MSLWDDVKHRVKKGLNFVYGPADLSEDRDPKSRLDREHDEKKHPGAETGKDWDRG